MKEKKRQRHIRRTRPHSQTRRRTHEKPSQRLYRFCPCPFAQLFLPRLLLPSATVLAQKRRTAHSRNSYLVRGTGKSPCRNKTEGAPRGIIPRDAQPSYFTSTLEISGFSRSYFTHCCVRCRVLSGFSDPLS